MKKILAILLALLVMTACAGAEEALPAGAVPTEGGWLLPSGETVGLVLDESGAPLSLITVTAAASVPEETSRETAEAAVLAEYPGALVILAEAQEDGSRSASIITETLCGTVQAVGSRIVSRELRFGTFIAEGLLTADGARAALSMLRPEAAIAEIERDHDDGRILYEGEACIGGAEYEFELSASTGKLLEWERD